MALGRWKEDASLLTTEGTKTWSLARATCAPRPLTSLVLLVGGHPLTTRQQAQALVNMRIASPTKAPHAPEMKMLSTGRSTLRHITEAELDVALRELSSGTAPGNDEIHCEELKQRRRVAKKCVLGLFNSSLRAGQVPAKWRHGVISTAAEAERASEQYGVLSAGDARERAVQADGTRCGAPCSGLHRGQVSTTHEAQAEDENRGTGTGREKWVTGVGRKRGHGLGETAETSTGRSPHGW
ncbi:hypothetical protein ERJ75_000415500 [Trypanosoma vivax]|nr:hypothetical protein TRVL_09891 [Trypanosoma vivax]KAH8617100.1 hypothetical protein ERJ75_000415500 [Trypanosoma vivax]